MEVAGYTLTPEQDSLWLNTYPEEYAQYVKDDLYNPDTRELTDPPPWMDDGNDLTGPFEIIMNPSWGTAGW